MSSIQTQSSKLDIDVGNRVDFFTFRVVQPNHIDILIMCLENSKLTGGGSIKGYSIDQRMQTISVDFEQELVKERMLSQRNIEIYGYKFLIVEPTFGEEKDYISHNLDRSLLILKNVPEFIDDYIVNSYAENLSIREFEDNSIVASNRSQYFKHIYCVRFSNEIDMAYCAGQLKRRPTLDGKKIEIQYGFSTGTLFFKIDPNLRHRTNVDSIAAYFGNKNKFEVNPLVQITLHEPFYLMKFDNDQSMTAFLLDKKKVDLLDTISGTLKSFDMKRFKSELKLENGNLFENIIFENLFDIRLLDEENLKFKETERSEVNSSGLSLISDPDSIIDDDFNTLPMNKNIIKKLVGVVDNIPSNENISRNINRIKYLFKKGH